MYGTVPSPKFFGMSVCNRSCPRAGNDRIGLLERPDLSGRRPRSPSGSPSRSEQDSVDARINAECRRGGIDQRRPGVHARGAGGHSCRACEIGRRRIAVDVGELPCVVSRKVIKSGSGHEAKIHKVSGIQRIGLARIRIRDGGQCDIAQRARDDAAPDDDLVRNAQQKPATRL